MDEQGQKRVDESWKEQAEREKRAADAAAPAPGGPAVSPGSTPASPGAAEAGPEEEGLPQARFDLFVSGLAVEALVALGDMAHPATRKQTMNLPHAKYLIDLMGILEEKTKGNLNVDEGKLLNDTLYQLRMRYLSKSGGS